MKDYTNGNPLGQDIIKGGVFFGSALTPGGAFSNIPKYINGNLINQKEPSLVLTLEQIKNSLSNSLKEQTGGNADEATIESYLYDFINLLVDHRDLRNYIFYGSANTEIAQNIKYIIDNYPYNTLIAQKYGNNFIKYNRKIISGKEKTEIIFPESYYYDSENFERIIIDNYNKFDFYDDSKKTNWNQYEILDKTGKRYSIDKVYTPYKSSTIFKVIDVENVTISVDSIFYNTIKISTDTAHNYTVGQKIMLKDLICTDINKSMQYYVQIFNGVGFDNYYYDLNNTEFTVQSVTLSSFNLTRNINSYENLYLNDYSLIPVYDSSIPGIVRLNPAMDNVRPFVIKIIVNGHIPPESLMDFQLGEHSYKGFLITPILSIINNWNLNLTPIQNQLLAPSPINPTPWPRREITNNIMNGLSQDDIENDLLNWINNPKTMFVKEELDDSQVPQAYSYNINYEYNMLRALALDETDTNQIIRRMIPADLISEIYDTNDFYFQRFLLIAGWMFDRSRLYTKFIKYSHTVNYTKYNQLSPQYYQHFASYYGLELLNDDSIDFSQLVIKTVPGDYFGLSSDVIKSNNYYQQTLEELKYSRQKSLLMSILFLYRMKGTQGSIHKLISLLGAPDGLLSLQEYAFYVNNRDQNGYPQNNDYSGSRVINNEKVHTPTVNYEIDPDYLKDKININNPLNKPYVYKAFYSNEYEHNLREISINTDPNGAIDNQIINVFGKQKYNYITFSNGEFANLQNNGDYYFLPLTLPDRFYGLSVEYMIPRDGIKNGIGYNQEEAICDVFSLYKIKPTELKPTIEITNILFDSLYTTATITVVNPHGYELNEKIFISLVDGIININNIMFQIQSIVSADSFTIFGDFSGSWLGNGKVISGKLDSEIALDDNLQYTYPLAIRYPQRNKDIDFMFAEDSIGTNIPDGYTNPDNDFNILYKKYPDSIFLDDSYIICRLEGNDLVIRLKIQSEITNLYGERCAVFPNFFEADGLNHSLRMVMRAEGVEIYKDYTYLGLARWINISNAGPYKALEIPKTEIKRLIYNSEHCDNNYEPINVDEFISRPDIMNQGLDAINWWDIFIGMPQNVDFYFKKLNFFENDTINTYNIGDRLTNDKNYTAEFYLFEVANPIKNSSKKTEYNNFYIPAIFYELYPSSLPAYYGYALNQVQDQYNRNIVENMGLSNKNIFDEENSVFLLNYTQDFFKFLDVFGNNAWQEDIHKSYEYNLFHGKLLELYKLYSNQILTYEALEDFMGLMENKFKETFKQFIPIVINLSSFGRLIRNSIFNQAKMRYPGAFKICEMQYEGSPSLCVSQVFRYDLLSNNGAKKNIDISFGIKQTGGLSIIPPTLIPWDVTVVKTISNITKAINTSLVAAGGQIDSTMFLRTLRISIDYEWFISTYGFSPNELVFYIQQGADLYEWKFGYGMLKSLGYHPEVIDNCGDIIEQAYNDKDVCGSILYKLPENDLGPKYIYFKSENKPKTFLHFENELGTHPIFIKYSEE